MKPDYAFAALHIHRRHKYVYYLRCNSQKHRQLHHKTFMISYDFIFVYANILHVYTDSSNWLFSRALRINTLRIKDVCSKYFIWNVRRSREMRPSSRWNRFALKRQQCIRFDGKTNLAKSTHRFSFDINLHSCTGVEKSSISSREITLHKAKSRQNVNKKRGPTIQPKKHTSQ